MRPACILLIIFILSAMPSAAQYFSRERALTQAVERAKDDSSRVIAMSDLANFYYVYRAGNKGDSVLQQQLNLAEVSSDKNLLFLALFRNPLNNISEWTSSETFDRAMSFVNKGVRYAQESGKPGFEVVAYMQKANLLRKRGQYDNALQQATLALSLGGQLDDDSLKAAMMLETGYIFLAKGDALSAYKNFNQAFDLAYKTGNIALQSDAYHHFAGLYQSLSNKDQAKKNLLKSMDLNKKHNNLQGLTLDYINLARLTDNKEYLDKVQELSKRSGVELYNFRAKWLMLAYYMTVEKNSEAARNYIYANEELLQSFYNQGKASLYWTLGNVYKYCGKADSALVYYAMAEPDLNKFFDVNIRKSVFASMADCLRAVGKVNEAAVYYEKALAISRSRNDLSGMTSYLSSLGAVYAQAGDFRKAWHMSQEQKGISDTLQKLSAHREVVLLEVDREVRKHEKDLEDEAKRTERTRNLQYLGISIAIAAVFILLVLAGTFPISKFTIRLSSFFAFICLFEFIILLIDAYFHKIAHGEPLKIWLMKVVLIFVLVPAQHYLEHALTNFLASQKLMRLRQQISFRNFMDSLKKKAPAKEAEIEDPAIL